jgi:hypothetical protein
MNSDKDSAALMAAFEKKPAGRKSSAPPLAPAKAASSSPATMSLQGDFDENLSTLHIETPPRKRRALCVRIPRKKLKKTEYIYYEPKDEVERIVREISGRKGDMVYEVKLFGDRVKQVSDNILGVQSCPSYHW